MSRNETTQTTQCDCPLDENQLNTTQITLFIILFALILVLTFLVIRVYMKFSKKFRGNEEPQSEKVELGLLQNEEGLICKNQIFIQLKNEIISELVSEQGENPVQPNLKTLLKDANGSLTKFQEINNEQIQNINDQIKSKIKEVNEELIKIKIQLNAVEQNQQKDHFLLDSDTKEIAKIWDQLKVLPQLNNQTDLQLQGQNLEQTINKVQQQSQQPEIQLIQKQIKDDILKETQGQIDKNTAQFNEFKVQFKNKNDKLDSNTKEITKIWDQLKVLPQQNNLTDLQLKLQNLEQRINKVQEQSQQPDIQFIQKQIKEDVFIEIQGQIDKNMKIENDRLAQFNEFKVQLQNLNDKIDSNVKVIAKIWDQFKVETQQNYLTNLQLQVQNLEQRINKVQEQSQQPDIQLIQKQIKEDVFIEIQGQIDKNTKIENDRLAQFNEFQVQFKNLNDKLDSNKKTEQKLVVVPPIIQENLERKKRVQDIIKKLYEVTNQQRYVERQFKYFVRDEQNLNELYRNYSIRSSDMKNKLSQICSSFREARGDGNCFYTSFGFQYLLIILLKYSDQEFNQFIEEQKTKQIPMKIRLTKDDEFNNQEEQLLLLDEFLYRLVQLRKIEDQQIRENTFIEHFKEFEEINNENDGCFYGLSTIFFRNIADQAVESHEFKNNIYDRFNLLIWEVECNSNEIVIDSLANYLKIYVKLLFFDNGKFREELYKPENKNQIILLIRPGHYNIGLLKQQEFQEDQGQNILVQNEHNAQQILNTNNFQQNQNENQQMY